ncbi:MAG: VOC family protein [Granulosicoccus sp.]
MKFSALYPELIVKDLECSHNFYIDLLGFTVEYRRDEERFLFLSYGEAQLMLLEDNDNKHSQTGPMEFPRGQGVNFSIVTPDLSDIARTLQSHNYPLRIPVRDQWHRQSDIEHGEKQLWVMDPDGYLIRFVESLGSRPAILA